MAVGGVYTTIAGDASANVRQVRTQYLANDWILFNQIVTNHVELGFVPGTNSGSRVLGHTGTDLDEYSPYNGASSVLFTAGADATVTADGDYFYGAFTDSSGEQWESSTADFAASNTSDVTWIVVGYENTAGSGDNNGLVSQATSTATERAGFYLGTDRSLKLQNGYGADAGTNQIATSANEITLDSKFIAWCSYDHSTKNVAIGSGTSGTATTTGTFTNALIRGGSGLEFGALAGSSHLDGRLYACFRLSGYYNAMTDGFSEQVLPKALAKLATIFGVS